MGAHVSSSSHVRCHRSVETQFICTALKVRSTRRRLSYIGHADCNSLQIRVTHRTFPKIHLVGFLQFGLSSQGLNTGSNPVGTTTRTSCIPPAHQVKSLFIDAGE